MVFRHILSYYDLHCGFNPFVCVISPLVTVFTYLPSTSQEGHRKCTDSESRGASVLNIFGY